jgi:hypothetical protein
VSIDNDNQARGPSDQMNTKEKLDAQENRLTADAQELRLYCKLFAFCFFHLQDL